MALLRLRLAYQSGLVGSRGHQRPQRRRTSPDWYAGAPGRVPARTDRGGWDLMGPCGPIGASSAPIGTHSGRGTPAAGIGRCGQTGVEA